MIDPRPETLDRKAVAWSIELYRKRREEGRSILHGFDPNVEKLYEALLAAEQRAEEAERRLAKLRPLRDTEWAVIQREHDVLHEARRLSNTVGSINTTRELDRALKRYDEAVAADRL